VNVLIAVAAGGAAGSVLRYLVGMQAGRWLGSSFPWGTLAVNVAGCLVMGLLVELMALHWSPGPTLRAFLTVGLLGGFTTFSAFSLDVALLAERGDLVLTILYAAASVLLSVGGLFVGLHLVRWIG